MVDFQKRQELIQRRDTLQQREKQILQDAQHARVAGGIADKDAGIAGSDVESLTNVMKSKLRSLHSIPIGDAQRQQIEKDIHELEAKRNKRSDDARAKAEEVAKHRAADVRAERDRQQVLREIADIQRQLDNP
jgi:hypothetical protein